MKISLVSLSVAVVLGALALFGGSAAQAQVNFASFGAGDVGAEPGKLTLNGTSVLNANSIRLTTTNIGEAGTAFYNTRLSLLSGFTTTFRYSISDSNEFGAADGLAFLISNDPAGAGALGTGGGDVGYGGLTNTFAIRITSFEGQDPNIGIHVLPVGGTELAFAPKTYAQVAGTHDVTVSFQNAVGGIGDLSVFFDNAQVIALSNVNLNPYVDGGSASQVGFSGGTGLLAENHDIDSWTLQTGAAIPEPGTLALLALAVPMPLLARRRKGTLSK